MITFFYSKEQEKTGIPVYEVLTPNGWKAYTNRVNDEVYKLPDIPDAKVVFMMLQDNTEPYIKKCGDIINMELHKCPLTWTGEFNNNKPIEYTPLHLVPFEDDEIETEPVLFKSDKLQKYCKIKFVIARESGSNYCDIDDDQYFYRGIAKPVEDNVRFKRTILSQDTDFNKVKDIIQEFADKYCIVELSEEQKHEEELEKKLNLPKDLFKDAEKEKKSNKQPLNGFEFLTSLGLPPELLGPLGNGFSKSGTIIMGLPDFSDDDIRKILKYRFGIQEDDEDDKEE